LLVALLFFETERLTVVLKVPQTERTLRVPPPLLKQEPKNDDRGAGEPDQLWRLRQAITLSQKKVQQGR